MSSDSCSWPHKTDLHKRIPNCCFFLIKTSKDVSKSSELLSSQTWQGRVTCASCLLRKPRKYLTFVCKTNRKDDHRERSSIVQVGRLRPSAPPTTLASGREQTSAELLARARSYVTPRSSRPWKLRPIPWKIILFSPVFSRIEPA